MYRKIVLGVNGIDGLMGVNINVFGFFLLGLYKKIE